MTPELRKAKGTPPALIAGPNRLFQVLDSHWRSPESGIVWYKSGQLKTDDLGGQTGNDAGVAEGEGHAQDAHAEAALEKYHPRL